jgi:Leo1-like protein
LFNNVTPLFIIPRFIGGATSVIRWRYRVDENGNYELGNDGEPIRESNARLVKLYDGTFKLLVGDATFFTTIHKTEKR